MGKTTTVIGIGFLVWMLWSCYSLYFTFHIPFAATTAKTETPVSNVISENEFFDLHLYTSTHSNVDWRHSRLTQDPKTPDRYVPRFGHTTAASKKSCCVKVLDKENLSICYVMSFRSQYTTKDKIIPFIPNWQSLRFWNSNFHLTDPAALTVTNITSCESMTVNENTIITPPGLEKKSLKFRLPMELQNANRIFLHVIGTRVSNLKRQAHPPTLRDVVIFSPGVEKLTLDITPDALLNPRRNLLKDVRGRDQILSLQKAISGVVPNANELVSLDALRQALRKLALTSIPNEITLGPVIESRPMTVEMLTEKGLKELIIRHPTVREKNIYFPPLLLNSLTSPRDEFRPLSNNDIMNACADPSHFSITELNKDPPEIKIRYHPSSFSMWLFQHYITSVMNLLEQKFGFPEYDIDSLKLMIGGKHPLLLICTFVISFLHIIFSFLAFSADISFWRHQLHNACLSISKTSLFMELGITAIVTLYLYDEGKSKLILSFSAVRLPLILWKLWKIRCYRDDTSHIPVIMSINDEIAHIDSTYETPDSHDECMMTTTDGNDDSRQMTSKPTIRHRKLEKELISRTTTTTTKASLTPSIKNVVTINEVEHFERTQVLKLIPLLYPIVIGISIYQLVYVPQKSWYSWGIHSLAMCAYVGGFISMTPQLFRNYKLQTVDHLPWTMLTYQAINTFIDDFFSFIIRMPKTHRMTVFRDDIIFIIYMIQRWMYRKQWPKSSALSPTNLLAQVKASSE